MKQFLKNIFYFKCAFWDFLLHDSKARILMYHSHELPNVFFNVSKEQLIWQLDYLQSHGYHFVTVSQLVEKMENKESLRNVIAITYDDGHRDFLTTALPEFIKRDIPVTLYFPKGMTGDTLVTSTGISCPLLEHEDIEQLKHNSLIEIGSHGVSHAEFPTVSDEMLAVELAREGEHSIAYPRGKYGAREVREVQKAGYTSAVTTISGFVGHKNDPFFLPRISIDRETNHLAFRAKLSTMFGFYASVRVWISSGKQ